MSIEKAIRHAISRLNLERLTVLYLALPYFIFCCGWLQFPWAILFSACLGFGIYLALRSSDSASISASHEAPGFTRLSVFLTLALAVWWVDRSGMGGHNYQNWDYFKHYSVFKDLIQSPWPVRYQPQQGPSVVLIYYVGFYLPAALAGKVFGWWIANQILFLWGVSGVALTLFWFQRLVRRQGIGMICFFILAGGLDTLGNYYMSGHGLPWTEHVQWWTRTWEYSCNSTLLFWSPQHGLSGWLSTALILGRWLEKEESASAPLWVALTLLWSPFVALGLFPLAVWVWARPRNWNLRSAKLLLISVMTAIPILLFLRSSQASIPQGWAWKFQRLPEFCSHYVLFVFIEFGIYLAVLRWRRLPRGMAAIGILGALVLLLLPFYHFGMYNDFVMRCSIPSLFILWCVVASSLFSREADKKHRWLLAIVFVGSLTSVHEISRSYLSSGWTHLRPYSEVESILTLAQNDPGNFSYIVGVPHSVFWDHFAKKSEPRIHGVETRSIGAPTAAKMPDEKWVTFGLFAILLLAGFRGRWRVDYKKWLAAARRQWGLISAGMEQTTSRVKSETSSEPRESGTSPLFDVCIAASLVLLLSPLYLWNLHDFPMLINTDEMIFVEMARNLLDGRGTNPFGVTYYYGFPAGSFLLIGRMCQMMGGITLYHARLVNAFFGLVIVGAGYGFYRLFWPRLEAFLAALLLGTNHALVGISRMAIRDNLPVLLEVTALGVLFEGLRSRRRSWLAVGGAIAGLGVYNYYSARVILLVWFVFLSVYFWFHEPSKSWRTWWQAAWPTLLAFALVAAPMLVSVMTTTTEQWGYPQHQIVLFAGGRKTVREWEWTNNTALALARNSWKGLTAFNNNVADRGMIYLNMNHGFVDPLSGILLWIGVLLVFRRRKMSAADQLALSGFLFIWLGLSLLTTKNPEYSRMLVVVPFVIYLVFTGLRSIAGAAPSAAWKKNIMVLVACAIAVWNVSIYIDFGRFFKLGGDAGSTTVRYAEARRELSHYHYYIVIDEVQPYIAFGKSSWKGWIALFADPSQSVEMLDSTSFFNAKGPLPPMQRPFTLFVNKNVWEASRPRLLELYPLAIIHPMTPFGQQIAIEVF